MTLTFAQIKIMSFTEESSSNSSLLNYRNPLVKTRLNTFAAQFPAHLVQNQSSVSCFSEMNRTGPHNELQGFCPWRWLKRNKRLKCNCERYVTQKQKKSKSTQYKQTDWMKNNYSLDFEGSESQTTIESMKRGETSAIHIYIVGKNQDDFKVEVHKERKHTPKLSSVARALHKGVFRSPASGTDYKFRFPTRSYLKADFAQSQGGFGDRKSVDPEHGALLSAVCDAILASGSTSLHLKGDGKYEKSTQHDLFDVQSIPSKIFGIGNKASSLDELPKLPI